MLLMLESDRGVDELKALQEVTGIKPSDNVVQEGYAAYVRNGRLDNLKALQEITGIKPSKKIYESLLEDLLR